MHSLNTSSKRMQLHWKILIGFVVGLIVGVVAVVFDAGELTEDWISPLGTVFISLLKLVAVPLIFCSLVTGLTSLDDLSKVSQLAGTAALYYLVTTVIAIVIGLLLVNTLQPGSLVPDRISEELREAYTATVEQYSGVADEITDRGPVSALVDVVPENVFSAFGDNRKMIQVVFISLLFGLALLLARGKPASLVQNLIGELNVVILKIVDIVLIFAPIGVFALMASTITTIAGDDLRAAAQLLGALGYYCVIVISGMAVHAFIVYGGIVRLFTSLKIRQFFAAIAPAQLVAFSTTSSAATLPVSMQCVERSLGVRHEVSSFVLPVGATINVDGTALYQAVAAVFIAQALGIDLGVSAQLTIVVTALLASIGTAPVPGAGLVMLVVVLESIGVPSAGLALILGVDRILDMFRTATNVSGDCAVAVAMNGQMRE